MKVTCAINVGWQLVTSDSLPSFVTSSSSLSTFKRHSEDVLVCDLVLMALLTFLFLSLSTEHVIFLCVLHVLAVFGLSATLIFSLIIIIIFFVIFLSHCGLLFAFLF